MWTGRQLFCRYCMRPLMCDRVQPSATQPLFASFPPPPLAALQNDHHLPHPPPPMPHTKFFSMFFWRLTPETTTLDDPYPALPQAKSHLCL
ncbi:hypothetical protein L208DRAFT_222476 [Tricholoma matsutake]|nr:hypothetical protein L208DRAFT_222476 [Tricholoma matsutake 945]